VEEVISGGEMVVEARVDVRRRWITVGGGGGAVSSKVMRVVMGVASVIFSGVYRRFGGRWTAWWRR
jgi:NAD/NADP transhydrogenase alpha subunit